MADIARFTNSSTTTYLQFKISDFQKNCKT